MITEIFIENRRLDINSDISSLLTFAIDDMKDFGNRHSTFSKTIVLPGTDNNNKIFGNLFDTGVVNDYDPALENIGLNFNPAKSARCVIFQDFFQTFKGTLRLLQIVKDKGGIEYEVALNGEITSLNAELTNQYLDNLDFSEYNHEYSLANITGSWDNTPGSGYYYPLIDNGTYSTGKHDWDYRTFKPALYVKEYIDKIFEAANFRYRCELFDTDRFKRIIIPHNQKYLTVKKTDLYRADITSNATVFGSSETAIRFNTTLGTAFNADVDKKEFTYVGGAATVRISYKFTLSKIISFGGYEINFLIRKNGTDIVHIISTDNVVNIDSFVDVPLAASDVITFVAYGKNGFQQTRINAGAYFKASTVTATPIPITLGDTVSLNDCIPKNIKQIDFLTSIVKLFNLYVYEDKFDERLIVMSPFVDFYTGESNVVDWTYKLDRDSPIKITPMSELNSKIYEFNYKEDNDYWNDLYKKRYNQVYGSKIYDSEFEFSTNTSKLEIIFAPTPIVGFSGEDKVYPTIYKKSGTTEETTDCVIRIMQSKKITGVTSWDIKDGVTVLGSYTDYPYAGHFDDPDSPDNDLNFGLVQELFFTLVSGDLTRTQFNLYWSAYMREITDKDSKLITAKFYLTAKDIFNLDFSSYIVIDNVLFRLNKIIDYNVTVPDLCTVELLKVIATSYSFPVGSYDTGIYRFLLWNDTEPLIDYDNTEMLYI